MRAAAALTGVKRRTDQWGGGDLHSGGVATALGCKARP